MSSQKPLKSILKRKTSPDVASAETDPFEEALKRCGLDDNDDAGQSKGVNKSSGELLLNIVINPPRTKQKIKRDLEEERKAKAKQKEEYFKRKMEERAKLDLKLRQDRARKIQIVNSKKHKTQKGPKNEKFLKNSSKPAKKDIWFDDVDEALLEDDYSLPPQTDRPVSESSTIPKATSSTFVKEKSFSGPTKVLAIDCEMVGCGPNGSDSHLARVSIANLFGHIIYDKYVLPQAKVTDYRTFVSGIRPSDLQQHGVPFVTVQAEVAELIKGRTLVGHALRNDFKVLKLSHPKHAIRDTSRYFKYLFGGRTPSLKKLTELELGVAVQEGEHDSRQDAQAAMRLYTKHRLVWEAENSKKLKMQKQRVAAHSKKSKKSHATKLSDKPTDANQSHN